MNCFGICFGVLWMDGGFLGNWERKKFVCEEVRI